MVELHTKTPGPGEKKKSSLITRLRHGAGGSGRPFAARCMGRGPGLAKNWGPESEGHDAEQMLGPAPTLVAVMSSKTARSRSV